MTKNSLEGRLFDHINCSKNPKFRLHRAIRKYGKENFIIETIDSSNTIEEADELEKKWISFYNSTNYKIGYNMSKGGRGRSMTPSIKTRKKISIGVNAFFKNLSPEERKTLTFAANNKKRGYTESDESKQLKSKSQLKRWKKANNLERKIHGQRSKGGVSEEGKIKQINALINSYSPAREKGRKKETVICPHCNKVGAGPIMYRYHFQNCKSIIP